MHIKSIYSRVLLPIFRFFMTPVSWDKLESLILDNTNEYSSDTNDTNDFDDDIDDSINRKRG